MQCILALDQGTTSSRAILFNAAGESIAVAQREFTQHYPRSGWVEHDPGEIWTTQRDVAAEAIRRSDVALDDIAAIGITNQRETTLVWDRATGEPIAPAIVWQDRRTAEMCDQLRRDGHAEMIRRKTGLVIDAYFSATKLRWLLDHVDGARDRAARGELAFGTIDAWLVWNLTAGRVHVTDVTNASRTMLLNIETAEWDDELLALFDIPRELLPTVASSSEVYGETDAELFGRAIPIAGIAGDQQAALFGQTCFDRGATKNTYGTGCFMLMNVGDQPAVSNHKLISTIAWRRDRKTEYALEGGIFIGGAVVQWLRDGLGVIKQSADVEALARSVPDAGGVCFVPAFTGLGAPHWDPYARGAIFGLTRATTAAHIARAALESIAHQVADLLDVMQRDSAVAIHELRVDGGAAADDLLMQLQADLLRVPVIRPRITETTALGAAYLAGLAVGVWRDESDIQTQWQIDRTFEPQMSDADVQDMRTQWADALQRTLTHQPDEK